MADKVIVVDDEVSIATLLKFNLEQAGFEVETAHDGKAGLELAEKQDAVLIILDLMLPEMDGLEVCKRLRQQKVNTPILMLTAKDDEFDKVLGLELGADDYLTKPFSPREVVARVKAILRRSGPQETTTVDADVIEIGDVKIIASNYEVFKKGERLELTPKEFELLAYLAKNKGRVLTRDQLLSAIWNYDFVGDTRIVDVHISHLREKIEPVTKKPTYIKTIRGLGYKMEEPMPE
ncbi:MULTISPECIES: response regulator transcription factor [Exiguobacterium]|uniref:response regulator transcription factor n=1 Tax=Exiguobacterium TaxID=33986 RepID=UPI00087775E8|nr:MULTISPECIES: response regulator transcription factor [Exiguobacterium]TCI25639.1 response regulator transcription factor [Exiguobacterium sp. SH5S4]TCI39506.1 response regulator transcription factor [Exiguobacterium sp. SH4S7]TCI64778.1 response regulator transcription factor [Exiguobacterium sp. SH3S1]TCI80768.1 response regulator transcription factor [Exiguobacterium sp. SH0S1]